MASSLQHILSMGSESLQNARLGVDVTGHNIANAHTPGYSRQRVDLEPKHPIDFGNHVIGDGAKVASVSRAHDKFLEVQLRKEKQNNGLSTALSKGLEKLETLFNPELSSTVRDRLDNFYNAMRELSTYPEEPSVRMHMVETAMGLTQSINTAHLNVVTIQNDATEEIKGNLEVLNIKLDEIAKLNQSIKEMAPGIPAQANDLEDKRDILIKEVAELIPLNAYKDENDNYALRGPGGLLLVEGPKAAQMTMENITDEPSNPRIMLRDLSGPGSRDVTDKFDGGKIGGLVEVRDKHAQYVRNMLNTMASQFGENFNTIHRQGFGIGAYGEQSGRDFFENHDGSYGEPAQGIAVSTLMTAEPEAIATGLTMGATGDNVIINELVKSFYEPTFEGNSTVTGLYDKIVGKLGINTMHAKEDLNASTIVLAQLEGQREATAGVSLDEEAANLLKYQHLFTASSRVITTVDEMFKTVLDLKR